jgi:multidrug resistance efflux pump
LDDDADTVADAEAELVTLRATLNDITREIANAKGDLARAAADAKKAAEAKA